MLHFEQSSTTLARRRVPQNPLKQSQDLFESFFLPLLNSLLRAHLLFLFSLISVANYLNCFFFFDLNFCIDFLAFVEQVVPLHKQCKRDPVRNPVSDRLVQNYTPLVFSFHFLGSQFFLKEVCLQVLLIFFELSLFLFEDFSRDSRSSVA